MTVNSHGYRPEDRPHADRPMYESTPAQAVDFSELVASVARLVTGREPITYVTGTIDAQQVPSSLRKHIPKYDGPRYEYVLGPAVHSPVGDAPAVFMLAQPGKQTAVEVCYETSRTVPVPTPCVERIEAGTGVEAGFYETEDVISCIAAIGAASIFEGE